MSLGCASDSFIFPSYIITYVNRIIQSIFNLLNKQHDGELYTFFNKASELWQLLSQSANTSSKSTK